MRFPGFIGPTGANRSVNVDGERTINFYPEIVDGGAHGKNQMVLHSTPGYRPLWTLSRQKIRGMYSQDGRVFAVAGDGFFELFNGGTFAYRGGLENNGNPATISSNGTKGGQLFITSGGKGYIFNLLTFTLSEITDPDFQTPVSHGAFLDGYFIALKEDTSQFQLSDLFNGLAWDGLLVGERSTGADDTISMVVEHRNLWLLGSQTSEIWFNNGDPDFPFAPIPGAFVENGAVAAFATSRADNSIFWLGGDERGAGVVYRANGYTPQRVSSHAVEFAIQSYANLDQTISWTYQQDGHIFYVLYFPNTGTRDSFHYVYDVSNGMWHQRALWDRPNAAWTPDIGAHYTHGFNMHLVGDRKIGVVYEMSQDIFDIQKLEVAA